MPVIMSCLTSHSRTNPTSQVYTWEIADQLSWSQPDQNAFCDYVSRKTPVMYSHSFPITPPQLFMPGYYQKRRRKRKKSSELMGYNSEYFSSLEFFFIITNRCCQAMHAATLHFPYLVSLFARRATVHMAE